MLHRICVVALWFQPEIGLRGYYGAILANGTPVGLCSAEKWNLGSSDSLRRGWVDGSRTGTKVLYMDVSEKELRKDGLLSDALRLTVPAVLLSLVTS